MNHQRTGDEMARLVYCLELWDLQHLILAKDLEMFFHYVTHKSHMIGIHHEQSIQQPNHLLHDQILLSTNNPAGPYLQ